MKKHATAPRPLSPGARAVLGKMAAGWDLGCYPGTGPGASFSYVLQRNGLGKGGESQNVNAHTAHALRKRDFIQGDYNWKMTRYTLTPAGRAAAEAKP